MASMTSGSELRATLYLIRHGESVGNVERRFGGHGPTPLSELGARQARATGEHMAERPPGRIVASDLLRAKQTAEAISECTGAPLSFDSGLRERSVGILDGMTFEDARKQHPLLWDQLVSRDPEFLPPRGESVAAVFDRVSAAIDRVIEAALAGDETGSRVAVVSHAMALNHAVAHLLGLGSPAQNQRVFVKLGNCSISTFHMRSGQRVVVGINDCGHLDPAGAM